MLLNYNYMMWYHFWSLSKFKKNVSFPQNIKIIKGIFINGSLHSWIMGLSFSFSFFKFFHISKMNIQFVLKIILIWKRWALCSLLLVFWALLPVIRSASVYICGTKECKYLLTKQWEGFSRHLLAVSTCTVSWLRFVYPLKVWRLKERPKNACIIREGTVVVFGTWLTGNQWRTTDY